MDCWVPRIASTRWIAFLAASMLLCGCEEKTSLPYYNTPDFNPVFIDEENEISQQITHHIAEFSLIDQDNRIVTQKDIEGKIHVANFIFTSCVSICPKMTNYMKEVQQEFHGDKEVVILSYSVTPWIDTPEVLQQYAVDKGIESTTWHLLTGNRSKIYELARKSYFAEEDLGFTRDSTEFLHTEHLILVDKSKRIRGIYNGTLQLEIAQLIEDIKILKNEK